MGAPVAVTRIGSIGNGEDIREMDAYEPAKLPLIF